MACNRLPDSFADMLLRLTEAHNGAVKHGDELPLIPNTAGLIGADRAASPQPRPAPFYLRGADAAPPSDPPPVILP